MTSKISKLFLLAALGLLAAAPACTANVHDNTINITDPKVSFDTGVNNGDVKPDQDLPMTVTATNVYLVDPKATPPADHVSDAGHLQFYFDSVDSAPIMITAQVKVTVRVPTAATKGPHKMICRIHKHDGTPTAAIFEVNITVNVTIGATDAGTPVLDAAID